MTRSAVVLFLGSTLMILVSCFGVRDISTTNLASVYRQGEHVFHPELAVFNDRDSSSKIFIRVKPEEFLFARTADGSFKANLWVFAELVRSYEETTRLDSTSASFSFDMAEKSRMQLLKMRIPVRHSGKLMIRLVFLDQNKNLKEEFFLRLNNEPGHGTNDFIATDVFNEPLFRSHLDRQDTFRLYCRDTTITRLFCKYYKRDFPLAAPPFSFDDREAFNYNPDSVFEINILHDQVLPGEGFYHYQSDTSVKSGFTLFRFDDGFPSVTSPSQMLEAMRYITTKKEYEAMRSAPSVKTAVDNFWLTRGGNEEKTRSLIRKYYSRVQDANKFFTSYTQGWRTDRGMIYIIFGSPSTVYRSAESETWIYGTPNSTLSLNYFFVKVNNPFTENDFSLSRAPVYESNWYRAVEIWRQGRAYNSFY